MKAVISLFLLVVLYSCSFSEVTHFKGIKMTIPYCVQVGESLTASQRQKVEECIEATFQEVDSIYNNWNPHSEVTQLLQKPANQKHALSPELKQLLLLATEIHFLSDGRFDPSVWSLAKLWKKGIPSSEEIEEGSKGVGFEKIHLEGDFFWKEQEETSLDLGGIAKGYAVDLLTENLKDLSLNSLYVEWGGEIRTVGSHPEGRNWMIGIPGVGTLELKDLAIATSGDYMQRIEKEGETFTHIIDPRTKTPLKVTSHSIASVSVVARTCAYADALATALMLFESAEEAQKWVATLEGVRCWIATREKQ